MIGRREMERFFGIGDMIEDMMMLDMLMDMRFDRFVFEPKFFTCPKCTNYVCFVCVRADDDNKKIKVEKKVDTGEINIDSNDLAKKNEAKPKAAKKKAKK